MTSRAMEDGRALPFEIGSAADASPAATSLPAETTAQTAATVSSVEATAQPSAVVAQSAATATQPSEVAVQHAEPGHRYPFFTHRECPYFPCHEGVDPQEFNCLFCYCPLYALGSRCGGEFRYSPKGVKDCTNCPLPHRGDAGTRMVKERFDLLKELASE